MLALSSTQLNQINALLRRLKITNTTGAHPDWPIWVTATKLLESIEQLQSQIKKQDVTIKQLQIEGERLQTQLTNVARNAAVSKRQIL